MLDCSAELPPTNASFPRQPADPPGGCWISLLPDELLFQLFRYLPQKDRYPLERDRGYLGPGLVCKRWWRVYEPVLLSDISCRDASKNSEHFRQITEILKEKPHLIRQVRVLNFCLPKEAGTNDLVDIRSLLEICRGIQTITVAGKLVDKEKEGLIFQAILCLSKVKNLTIPYEAFFLARQGAEMPFLKHLKLIRENGIHETVKHSQQELEEILPLDRYNTGTVTSIILSNPRLRIDFLSRRILHWPSNLLHLTIDRFAKDPPCLQRCIDLHRTSLRTIKLGPIMDRVYTAESTSPLPNFSACVSLEELTLSAVNVFFNPIGYEAFNKSQIPDEFFEQILGPKLHLLTINFEGFDTWGRCERLRRRSLRVDFGWFRKFSERITNDFPSSMLKKIAVLHDPHRIAPDIRKVWYQKMIDHETAWTVWPWEYMARAKQDVEEFGLEFEFEARWTREEWQVIVERCGHSYDFFDDRFFELGPDTLFPEKTQRAVGMGL